MDRREFVSMLSLLTLGTKAALGERRARDRLDRIGLELYTVRDELARDFDGTLRRVAAIGYREVEFADYHGRSIGEVRTGLAAAGLTAPSAQVTSTDLRLAWAARLEQARALGHRYLVCGWVPPAERRSLADWRSLATLLNAVGQAASKAGIQLAYHNHDFELKPLGGRVPTISCSRRPTPRWYSSSSTCTGRGRRRPTRSSTSRAGPAGFPSSISRT